MDGQQETEIKTYTLDEVEKLLKIAKRTIYRLIKDGKLKASKIGGTWLVTRETLDKMLDTETDLSDLPQDDEDIQRENCYMSMPLEKYIAELENCVSGLSEKLHIAKEMLQAKQALSFFALHERETFMRVMAKLENDNDNGNPSCLQLLKNILADTENK